MLRSVHHPLLWVMMLWVVAVGGSASLGSLIARLQQGFPLKGGWGGGGRGLRYRRPLSVPESIAAAASATAVPDRAAPCGCRGNPSHDSAADDATVMVVVVVVAVATGGARGLRRGGVGGDHGGAGWVDQRGGADMVV